MAENRCIIHNVFLLFPLTFSSLLARTGIKSELLDTSDTSDWKKEQAPVVCACVLCVGRAPKCAPAEWADL